MSNPYQPIVDKLVNDTGHKRFQMTATCVSPEQVMHCISEGLARSPVTAHGSWLSGGQVRSTYQCQWTKFPYPIPYTFKITV